MKLILLFQCLPLALLADARVLHKRVLGVEPYTFTDPQTIISSATPIGSIVHPTVPTVTIVPTPTDIEIYPTIISGNSTETTSAWISQTKTKESTSRLIPEPTSIKPTTKQSSSRFISEPTSSDLGFTTTIAVVARSISRTSHDEPAPTTKESTSRWISEATTTESSSCFISEPTSSNPGFTTTIAVTPLSISRTPGHEPAPTSETATTDLETFPTVAPLTITRPPPPETETATANSTVPTATATPPPTNMYGVYKKYSRFMMNELSERNRTCNMKNVEVRSDWNTLGEVTQRSYLKGVECLHFKNPSQEFGPGNETLRGLRIDDYVKVVMTQGYNTAFSGLHLHWQRILIHIYEKELREQCGYNGTLPYWDFSKFAPKNTISDPIFRGQTCFGGNGNKAAHLFGHGDVVVDYFGKNNIIPPGSGGGCVTNPPPSGIHDFAVRLGRELPFVSGHNISTYPLAWASVLPNNTNATFDHSFLTPNPRCITRDFNTFTAKAITYQFVEKSIGCDSFACLLDAINGSPKGTLLPLEFGARATVGGLHLDPYTAASDPLWWLMAANVDRLWALWQGQVPDPQRRFNEVAGTKSPWMSNATSPVVLHDLLEFGSVLGNETRPWRTVNDGKSTVEGDLCYWYSNPQS